MSKITSEQSKEIYELATSPSRKISRREIARRYGISEYAVRHHIKKWEKKLHEVAKTNEKAANALVNHALDVHKEAQTALSQVKVSIVQARNKKVSPERLAPLFSNWIKAIELASELLGEINKSPIVNVQVDQQSQEYKALKTAVTSVLCEDCKKKVREELHELVSQ